MIYTSTAVEDCDGNAAASDGGGAANSSSMGDGSLDSSTFCNGVVAEEDGPSVAVTETTVTSVPASVAAVINCVSPRDSTSNGSVNSVNAPSVGRRRGPKIFPLVRYVVNEENHRDRIDDGGGVVVFASSTAIVADVVAAVVSDTGCAAACPHHGCRISCKCATVPAVVAATSDVKGSFGCTCPRRLHHGPVNWGFVVRSEGPEGGLTRNGWLDSCT